METEKYIIQHELAINIYFLAPRSCLAVEAMITRLAEILELLGTNG